MPDRSKFIPQVGDVVVVRDWDDMADEFGLNEHGNIDCRFVFIEEMKYLCGGRFIVREIRGFNNYILYREGDRTSNIVSYSISIDMLRSPDDFASDLPDIDSTGLDSIIGIWR